MRAICRFVVLPILPALALFGQNGKPSFEVASVKVADHGFVPGVTGKMTGGPGTSDPGRIVYTQVRLMDLLMKAWDMDPSRIRGPAWLIERNNLYNLTAVLPVGSTKEDVRTMLQHLLSERFAMVLHHETRTLPGYDLVVAPGGIKLKPASNPDTASPGAGPSGKVDDKGFLVLPNGHGAGVRMVNGVYAKFQSYTIAELMSGPYLKSFIQQATGDDGIYVQDKTDLKGLYDFTLKFDARAPDLMFAPGVVDGRDPASKSDPTGLPNLFRALETQLGLKLIKTPGVAVDAIMIDRISMTPID